MTGVITKNSRVQVIQGFCQFARGISNRILLAGVCFSAIHAQASSDGPPKIWSFDGIPRWTVNSDCHNEISHYVLHPLNERNLFPIVGIRAIPQAGSCSAQISFYSDDPVHAEGLRDPLATVLTHDLYLGGEFFRSIQDWVFFSDESSCLSALNVFTSNLNRSEEARRRFVLSYCRRYEPGAAYTPFVAYMGQNPLEWQVLAITSAGLEAKDHYRVLGAVNGIMRQNGLELLSYGPMDPSIVLATGPLETIGKLRYGIVGLQQHSLFNFKTDSDCEAAMPEAASLLFSEFPAAMWCYRSIASTFEGFSIGGVAESAASIRQVFILPHGYSSAQACENDLMQQQTLFQLNNPNFAVAGARCQGEVLQIFYQSMN